MDSVRDFYAFEWISVAMGCLEMGRNLRGQCCFTVEHCGESGHSYFRDKKWVSYHLAQCHGGTHALLFS